MKTKSHIRFSAERMESVIENHELWWDKRLPRPLLRVILVNAYPSFPSPPLLTQQNCGDLTRPAEEVIDAWDAYLSTFAFLGDAYPQINFDAFGPGVLSAFCGSVPQNTPTGVWFMPAKEKDIAKLQVKYDPEHPWAKRIKALYRAGMERWEGNVIMGMPDLGGVTDVAAALLGTENLLLYLLDEPDEVERLCREIHLAWQEAYADFARVLDGQPAFTDWNGLLSRKPAYILQSDFSAMISPAMYRRYEYPYLKDNTEKLYHTIYHLDGPDALRHLPAVLSLEKLNAVQWVPGSGNPPSEHWPEVFRAILDAGKQTMLVDGTVAPFTALFRRFRAPFYATFYMTAADKATADELLSLR